MSISLYNSLSLVQRTIAPPGVCHFGLSSVIDLSMCMYNCGKRAVQLRSPVSFLPHLHMQRGPPPGSQLTGVRWTAARLRTITRAFYKLTEFS